MTGWKEEGKQPEGLPGRSRWGRLCDEAEQAAHTGLEGGAPEPGGALGAGSAGAPCVWILTLFNDPAWHIFHYLV